MPASIRMTLKTDVIGSSPFAGIFERAHALGVTDAQASQIELADGQSDVSLLVTGLATVTALVIYSDVAITVKINGASSGFSLAAKGFLAITGTSITAITASNASGSTANIFRLLAGS